MNGPAPEPLWWKRPVQYALVIGLLTLALTCYFLLLSPGASGETFFVDDDGGADYETIAEALENASDGDSICVWDGVYQEELKIRKSVSLIGNGSETTIIDGSGVGNDEVVTIEANWVNISGFSVQGDPEELSKAAILVGSDHNRIEENNCSNSDSGILLESCSFNVIKDNILYNNSIGVKVYIELKTVRDKCTNTLLENNTCILNSCGLYLFDSKYITLERNTVENGGKGIKILDSKYITLRNNTLTDCDLAMEGWALKHWDSHDIDTSNLANGKPIVYLANVSGTVVDQDASWVLLGGCDNVTVKGQDPEDGNGGVLAGHCENITVSGGRYLGSGIILYKSSYISIMNNVISTDSGSGIKLFFTNNSLITGNTLDSNRKEGIHLTDTSCYNIISNNSCSKNGGNGIFIGGGWQWDDGGTAHVGGLSQGNQLLNNSCSENSGHGIELQAGSHDSNVTGNDCSDNGLDGILCYIVERAMISWNRCSGNEAGINLSWVTSSSISHNNCSANRQYGLILYASRVNEVHHNSFLNNSVGIFIDHYVHCTTPVNFNNIVGNTLCGLKFREPLEEGDLQAENNWWGDSTGPEDFAWNPDGKGDLVEGPVSYKPWLESAVDIEKEAPHESEKPNSGEEEDRDSGNTDIQSLMLSAIALVTVALVGGLLMIAKGAKDQKKDRGESNSPKPRSPPTLSYPAAPFPPQEAGPGFRNQNPQPIQQIPQHTPQSQPPGTGNTTVSCPRCQAIIELDPGSMGADGRLRIRCPNCGTTGSV